MLKPKSLTRTTMAELDNLPHAGIYVLAYMGRVLYVGKAVSVADRLRSHLRGISLIGAWLLRVREDWGNVRLDVLEQPDEDDSWLPVAEEALIKRFNPLFNTVLNA